MVKGYFIVLLWNQVWVVTARRRTHKPINARCHTEYTVPATGHRCCSLWLGPFPCSSWKRCGNVSSAKSILCGFSFSLTLCNVQHVVVWLVEPRTHDVLSCREAFGQVMVTWSLLPFQTLRGYPLKYTEFKSWDRSSRDGDEMGKVSEYTK